VWCDRWPRVCYSDFPKAAAAAAIEVVSERREGLTRESKASSIHRSKPAALRCCERRDEPSLSLTSLRMHAM